MASSPIVIFALLVITLVNKIHICQTKTFFPCKLLISVAPSFRVASTGDHRDQLQAGLRNK